MFSLFHHIQHTHKKSHNFETLINFFFQTRSLYLVVIGSLVSVCILQFVNDMILCSLALSFAAASIILMSFHVSVC